MSDDPADTETLTVGELNRRIRQTLSRRFPEQIWVEGEIRGLKRHSASGHVYFELVDPSEDGRQADAVIQVALYRLDKDAVNRLLKRSGSVRMDDGVHIRIRGSLDYYPPQGRLQLRMQWIDPTYTLGRLEAERRRLVEALTAEDLLGRNASLPYPMLPLRVGLVTSAGSAAHEDFLHELEASGISWRVTLVSAAVQGPNAEAELTGALRTLAARQVDVIAIVRGGGARTDLAAFDSEVVARTIADLAVPVLTGIGHETDRSVADLVAARAAKTPTACAASLVADVRAAHDRARRAWDAIAVRSALELDRRRGRLDQLAGRLSFAGLRHVDRRAADLAATAVRLDRSARQRPEQSRRRVAELGAAIGANARRHTEQAEGALVERRRRLVDGAPRGVRRASQDLAVHASRAAAADPARLLERGWSVLRTADGSVITSVRAVRPGDELVATLADGSVRSTVTAVDPDDRAGGGHDEPRD
jgi:exodeoxyribonuclease VII large subunit